MEHKVRFIANYSESGHYMYPEDTWDDTCVIKNEKDLLSVCKTWYKISASQFNDYPFHSLFNFSNITFTKQKIIIDDNGEIFYGKKEECEKPEYFDKVKDEFDTWIKNIKERLPKLREAINKRINEVSERKKLDELKLKYGE